jgi:hypothetical protein
VGRLSVRALIANARHQRRQTWSVRAGVFGAKAVKRIGLTQQARAPAFDMG